MTRLYLQILNEALKQEKELESHYIGLRKVLFTEINGHICPTVGWKLCESSLPLVGAQVKVQHEHAVKDVAESHFQLIKGQNNYQTKGDF